MDDPVSPGIPGGGMPPPPPPPGGPPPMGGPMGGSVDDPHDKIIEALKRIEDKLTAIAAKLGA